MTHVSQTVTNLRQSAFLKMLIIGFLIILLLIPLGFVGSVNYDRQERYQSVLYELGNLWGSSQDIVGPVLSVPYQRLWTDDKNKLNTEVHQAHFLPERLSITGEILPEKRYRSIFEVVVYRVNLTIEGEFNQPSFDFFNIADEQILWQEAKLVFGISDTRGIRDNLTLDWNQQPIEFLSGSNSSLVDKGLHLRLPQLNDSTQTRHQFKFQLSLNGSDYLSFAPVGKQTLVDLTSTWPDPSFSGAFLPIERKISQDGFQAHWQVSHLGRSYPQYWNSEQQNYINLSNENFRVNLLLPVDFYQKVERSVKYGILFILLTFTTFFLFEIFNPIRIHPLQYLMVGAALCIFYLLLLSISEQLNFSWAYLIASIATIGLITSYGRYVLGSQRRALIMGSALVALYMYLYVLLHLQDYALLFGAIGLFCILALIMFITRHVDWYSLNMNMTLNSQDKSTQPPTAMAE